MSKETQARQYADDKLSEVNPKMHYTSYSRANKMQSPCFNGNHIEQAFIDGWDAGIKSVTTPPEKEYYGG